MTAFGGYELIRRLGVGAMGEVWEAHDVRLGRAAAVKILKRVGDDERARFKREARLASRLSHPNIATLYEVGEFEGRPFIAMQKIDGVPIGQDALPLRRRIEALRDAARAVHFAHAKGIIHRDLKPENILVDAEGRAFVLDFGLARTLGGDAEEPIASSISGHVVGTPPYMPPEQARGRLHDLDARADVYGLGAVLYVLLSGRPPFQGRTDFETLQAVVNDDPAPPAGEAGDRDLATICLKSLEKDRERRYASAEMFAAELDRWLAGVPIQARPPSALDRIRKHVRREPVLWALAVLLGGSIVTGAGVGVSAFKRQQLALRGQLEAGAQRNAKEREAILTEEKTARSLRLVTEIEESAQRLEEFDRALARRLDDAGLNDLRAQIGRLIEDLTLKIAASPQEGGFYYLKGRAHRLREEDDLALEALLKVDGRENSEWGRAADVGSLAAYERLLLYLNRLFDARFRPSTRKGMGQTAAVAARDTWLPKLNPEIRRLEAGHLQHENKIAVEIVGDILDGRFDDAVSIASREIERGGETAYLYFLRAISRKENEKETRESIRDLDAAIARHAGRARAYMQRGVCFIHLKQYDGAVEDFSEAIRLKPDYGIAYYNRGWCRERQEDLPGALKDYDLAATFAPPGDAEPINARGTVLHRLKKTAEAVADFEAAVRIDSRYELAYRNLGAVLHQRGEHRRAIENYDKALVIERDDADALRYRGLCHLDLGEHPQALQDLTQALLILSSDKSYDVRSRCEALSTRGNTYAAMGDLERARREFDETIKLDKTFALGWSNRASVFYKLGDYDAALADAEEAIRLDADYANTYSIRAAVRLARGESQQAIADFSLAIERDPKNPAHFRNRSVARDRAGDLRGAAGDIEQALMLAPPDWPERKVLEGWLTEIRKRLKSDDF